MKEIFVPQLSKKDLRRYHGFDPITCTFSKNSRRQRTFCLQKFADNHQQYFSFTPQATFPDIIWIFTEGEDDWIEFRLPFKIFSTLKKISTHCVSYFFSPFLQLVEFALITCRHVPSQLAKKNIYRISLNNVLPWIMSPLE